MAVTENPSGWQAALGYKTKQQLYYSQNPEKSKSFLRWGLR
jgi:hypothetical protein